MGTHVQVHRNETTVSVRRDDMTPDRKVVAIRAVLGEITSLQKLSEVVLTREVDPDVVDRLRRNWTELPEQFSNSYSNAPYSCTHADLLCGYQALLGEWESQAPEEYKTAIEGHRRAHGYSTNDLVQDTVEFINDKYFLWPKKTVIGTAIGTFGFLIALTGFNVWVTFFNTIDSERIRIAEERAEASAALLEKYVASVSAGDTINSGEHNHGSQAP